MQNKTAISLMHTFAAALQASSSFALSAMVRAKISTVRGGADQCSKQAALSRAALDQKIWRRWRVSEKSADCI